MAHDPDANTQPWVLLRGLGREARHWGEFPQILRDALHGASVLTPDLPGNGLRWQETSAASIAGQCDSLRAALSDLLAQGPVNVLAISLGGMVAVDWAHRYPSEVARLALVNTSFASIAPFWRRLRWHNYPTLLSLPLYRIAAREQGILRLTSNRIDRRACALPQWVAWQRETPVTTGNLLRQLYAAASYRAPKRWPTCPTLVLASEQDRLVDPYCSVKLAELAGWPIAMHPNAGHDLPLDDPQWLAAQISQWSQATCKIACALEREEIKKTQP